MTKTTLQFPTLMELVKFQKEVKSASFRIIITTTSIIGNFTPSEIEFARSNYKAVVVGIEEIESA